jgi:hypothetical protein
MTNPTDRIKENFKSPYPVDSDGWDAIITAIGEEIADLEDAYKEIEDNKFIDTANEGSLKRLASIFDIEKRDTETLDEFRARLKVALRRQISSATIPEIREVTSVILDQPLEDIEIVEPYDFSPAFIELKVNLEGFDGGALIDIVELITAAGVDVGIRVVIDVGDSLGIRDATELSFPDLEDEFAPADGITVDFPEFDELTVLDDSTNSRTDQPDQSHWNEGVWNIDHYDTALVRFTFTPEEVLELSDSATSDFPRFSPDLVLADSATADFPVKPDTTILSDGTVEDFPESESTFVATQDENVMFDLDQQAHWNEGTWNIDHYDTAIFEFTITPSDSLAMGDAVEFPEIVDPTTPYAIGDDVTDISEEPVKSAVWTHSVWTQPKGTTVWGERLGPDSIPHFRPSKQGFAVGESVVIPTKVSPVTAYAILDSVSLPSHVEPGDSTGLADDVATPSPVSATEAPTGQDSTQTSAEPVRSAVWTHSTWSRPKGTNVWGERVQAKSIPQARTSSSFATSDATSLAFTSVTDATWNDATYNSSVTVWA